MTTLTPSDAGLMGQTDAHDDAKAVEMVTHGVLAEYPDVDGVIEAAKACRDAGFKNFDIHAPFPIHGLEKAMGMKYTNLPWIVLACGLTGLATGTFLMTYTMGGLGQWLGFMSTEATANGAEYGPTWMTESLKPYPFMISGKPMGELPQYIPPMFELTILFSAFGAVFGMFLMNRLPLLHHPLYRAENFKRATDDRFFVVVEASDPKFDTNTTAEFLAATEPLSVQVVQDEAT